MNIKSRAELIGDVIDKLIRAGKYTLLFSLIKAFRQGLVYGVKVRAPHALVLNLVWSSGPLRAIPGKVLHVTRIHALGLALSSVIFTLTTTLLRQLQFTLKREPSGSLALSRDTTSRWWHGALGGFLVGYCMWGDFSSSVHMQMMMYIASRVLVALYHVVSQRLGFKGTVKHYRIYSGLLWALLMTLIQVEPETLQSSMRASLNYVFFQSKRFSCFKDLIVQHR